MDTYICVYICTFISMGMLCVCRLLYIFNIDLYSHANRAHYACT